MDSAESLEELYKRKFGWIPENLRSAVGHFNVFNVEPFVGEKAQPIPYKRRDFYKIMFIQGQSQVHFADQIIPVKKQALSFSNPQIPYRWEHLDRVRGGSFCIFNRHFFQHFGLLDQYAVFQPGGLHIFELSDEQAEQVRSIFERLFNEINSDYVHKYDVCRTLVFELLHFAMKMQPSAQLEQQPIKATQRAAALFMELLERQFPIDELHPAMHLRNASDFAKQLNIHVNHLNRSVKESTQKTTTQLISERILQEAKLLLKNSHWQVGEIAASLGFAETTHFNNFFKKHTHTSPLKYRKGFTQL